MKSINKINNFSIMAEKSAQKTIPSKKVNVPFSQKYIHGCLENDKYLQREVEAYSEAYLSSGNYQLY